MRISKDQGNYMRWKTIQQQGPCEGQFEGICQGPKGIDVPMRQLAHRRAKDRADAEQRLMSMNQDPNKKPGHKPRLYDALKRPQAYRHLCPTCHAHHDKHMFDEGYQEPKWVLDNKFRQIVMDRNKNKRKIKSHGGIVKSINDFLVKYEQVPEQPIYPLHNQPSMDTRKRAVNPFDEDEFGDMGDDYEAEHPTPTQQDVASPKDKYRYKRTMHQVSPEGRKQTLDKIVGEDIPYAKSLVKDISTFLSKRAAYAPMNHRPYFDPATNSYNKYKPWETNAEGMEERILPSKSIADQEAKKNRAQGYNVTRVKMPDGSIKLVRPSGGVHIPVVAADVEDYNMHQGDIASGDAPTSNHLTHNIGNRNRMSRKLIDPEQVNYRSPMQSVSNMKKAVVDASENPTRASKNLIKRTPPASKGTVAGKQGIGNSNAEEVNFNRRGDVQATPVEQVPEGLKSKQRREQSEKEWADQYAENKRRFGPFNKSITKSINQFVRKFETENLPHEGTAKYKPQLDARTRLNNKLKPHEMSNRKQEVNPASSPPMGFGQKTNPADHVVDNYVPVDKTHTFKYRGRTYDAGKMTPEEIADILAEMEQQIQ
jgi:hypothetical protein